MVMITTCPACHTRFRVTPEQMDAHGGDVRCGRCAKVFNAHAYLEHELEELQHEGQPQLPFEEPGEHAALPAEEEAQQFVATEGFPAEWLAVPSFEGAPAGERTPPPQVAEEALVESHAEAESPAPEWGEDALPESPAAADLPLPVSALPAIEEAAPFEPVPEAHATLDGFAEIADEPKKARFFWLWLIGTLLLLASLAVQGLYFFRSDLAARHPEFKPLLHELCGVLQCTIRLPANPDLLSIETSNLEADPQLANQVALNAILRNRAKLAQEYPQLELTLTDTQDRMVARRIFTPGEYAKGADLSRGMAPNEEMTVRLNLDLGDLKAAGYRVLLFYPQ